LRDIMDTNGWWRKVSYKGTEGWITDFHLGPRVAAITARYVADRDRNLSIELYANNRFTMSANLLAGLGSLRGAFVDEGERYLMTVEKRDFMGFAGDRISEFALVKVYPEGAAQKGAPPSLRFTMTERRPIFGGGPFEGWVYSRQE